MKYKWLILAILGNGTLVGGGVGAGKLYINSVTHASYTTGYNEAEKSCLDEKNTYLSELITAKSARFFAAADTAGN